MFPQVQTGQLTIRGVSVAGIYTCLHVPELGVLLDLGICHRSVAGVHNVFLSHVHGDHIGGLAAFLGMRDMLGMPQVNIHLPAEHMADLAELVQVTARIHRYRMDKIKVVPMTAGEERALPGGVFVRPFKTFHTMPSLGYQFLRRKQKLLPAFSHLTGQEIAAQKKAGDITMFETVESLELAYATDTTYKVLDNAPNLFTSKVTILECTYIDKHRTAASSHGHMCLQDIVDVKDQFKNDHLVLMHFSQGSAPMATASHVTSSLAGITPAVHAFGTNTFDWFG